ncbi:hypothetical protein LIER_35708 [Lithospermum erythrorhizon]|uniref:Uncharacterized protein n=1 Tax=Lithospermum erythrorhizon TaxID=34254 RepID=A0AAV3NWN8_LITER
MRPPNIYKDVQKLTRCLAALNRFISKSSERKFPFFKNLRRMSKEKFNCDEGCQGGKRPRMLGIMHVKKKEKGWFYFSDPTSYYKDDDG